MSNGRHPTWGNRSVLELVEFAFWPDVDGALGLLLCRRQPCGDRVTRLVCGRWLHAVVGAMKHGEALQDVPDAAVLPVERPGWPDDWEPGTSGLLDTIVADLIGGTDRGIAEGVPPAEAEGAAWGDVRAHIEIAELEVLWESS